MGAGVGARGVEMEVGLVEEAEGSVGVKEVEVGEVRAGADLVEGEKGVGVQVEEKAGLVVERRVDLGAEEEAKRGEGLDWVVGLLDWVEGVRVAGVLDWVVGVWVVGGLDWGEGLVL